MTKIDAVLEALRKCHRKLRQSKAGQDMARDAGQAFAELATEVDRVIEERRSGIERRKTPRSTADRRSNRTPAA